MADDRRAERFRDALFAIDRAGLQRALRALPRPISDALHKAARVKYPALNIVGDPTAALQRVREDQWLHALADEVTDEILAAARDLLGDNADEPSVDHLRSIVDPLRERFPQPVVTLLFANIACIDVEASDACHELLESEPSLQPVPPPDDGSSRGAVPPRPAKQGPSDEVREQRRARRQAEAEQRRAQKAKSQRPSPHHRKPAKPTASVASTPAAPGVVTGRRAAVLTREQERRFDPADPLAGRVVVAAVPFDDDLGGKDRPCVVVAGGDDELLVFPGYSDGGLQSRRWQSHGLRDWRAAGLDRPTFVAAEPHVVARGAVSLELGRLSDDDWNALW